MAEPVIVGQAAAHHTTRSLALAKETGGASFARTIEMCSAFPGDRLGGA